jgi:hypothetical protein
MHKDTNPTTVLGAFGDPLSELRLLELLPMHRYEAGGCIMLTPL